MNCRLCGDSNLFPFLDLGLQPPSDQFRSISQLSLPTIYYPLVTCICERCHFIQLSHVVAPEILYQEDYPYESSTTETGKNHFYNFAKSVVTDFGFNGSDLAVDIGSNIGVLLSGFKSLGLRVQGVDPAQNIVRLAQERGIPTICDFFGEKSANDIVSNLGTASVITATNVFAHVDDLSGFMVGIKKLLDPQKGIFVIEAPHFLNLVKNYEYDTIYHEHLSYISIEPLVTFFEKFNLEIIKVEEKDIHGGSIRIFISGKSNYKIDQSVLKIIEVENKSLIYTKEALLNFAKRVQENKFRLQELVFNLRSKGKRVVAVSAPAKGMTLLNYCKFDRDSIDYVTEKSTLKIGSYTPGGHIPVYDDSRLLNDQPDYAILLAWNFADEIVKNNSEYVKRGGKFIIPIPFPKIL